MELIIELMSKPFLGIVCILLRILLMVMVDAEVGELIPAGM